MLLSQWRHVRPRHPAQLQSIRFTSRSYLLSERALHLHAYAGQNTKVNPYRQHIQTRTVPAAVVSSCAFGTSRIDSDEILPENRRNIAVIAHVDHGKTTLVDGLLKLNSTRTSGEVANTERVMDSDPQEKERGITILSKATNINYLPTTPDAALHRISIVDTPGHADFGGEVERVMNMVDGVLVVVCATEGPMTQTRFVLGKALQQGLQPILVINKVDRPTARVEEVESEVFDLVASLDPTDEQMEYQTLYASAMEGWATSDFDQIVKGGVGKDGMRPILDSILSVTPPPQGKVHSGTVRVNDVVTAVDRDGHKIQQGKITKLMTIGLQQSALEEARAGDLVSIADLATATVGSTLCDPEHLQVIESPAIDPPTLTISFGTNSSPFVGKDGTKMTAAAIKNRLLLEAETNVSLKVEPAPDSECFEVHGRGEMQIGVLVEAMRREGFELSLEAPQVVVKEIDGKLHEPMEELMVDVDVEFAETVLKHVLARKGELQDSSRVENRSRVTALIPTRGLLGLRGLLTTETRGSAVVNSRFVDYVPHLGPFERGKRGSMISVETGKTTAYALEPMQARGRFYVGPGTEVYAGMVIGESNKQEDTNLNPVKAKKLTNMRAAGKDGLVKLSAPIQLTLEDCIGMVKDDEIVEVTPKHVRLRKKLLDEGERNRANKTLKKELADKKGGGKKKK